ncbi:MAG: hypothetical protein DRJ69_01610 [Thermoprotei archaeon]|nr:MAG: hypothetical protein DRJ69_01610 [Thermoprotei archaeon]
MKSPPATSFRKLSCLDLLLLKIADPLSVRLSTPLFKGLWFKSPRAYAIAVAKALLSTTMLSMVVGFTAYIYVLRSPLAFLPLLSPVLLLAVCLYLPQASAKQRKSRVEAELPIFSVLASVMAVTGLSLVRTFEISLTSRLFPAMAREAALLKRNSLYFNRSPLEALEEVAREHPSDAFRQWILGYTSVLRSGGDVAAYLASKAREFLRVLERKWVNYANTTNVLGEAVLALFLICPLSIALMSLIFAGELSLWLNNIYSLVVVPCVALASSAFIHAIQPKSFNSYEFARPAIASLTMGAVALPASALLLGLEPYEALLVSLLTLSTPLAILSHLQLKSASQAEKALPDFLRDVTEQVKLGFDIRESLFRLSYRSYNKHFDQLLASIRSHLALGVSFQEAILALKTSSWTVKSVLLILAQLSESGGGRPMVMEMLTDYVSHYCAAKAAGKSSVKLQVYVGYGAPAFMVAGVVMLESLAKQLMPLPEIASTQATFAFSYASFQGVVPTVMLMVVVTSFIIGVIIAKVSDMTSFSFKHPLTCLAVAAISMKAAPLIV